jgi:mannose-6-phosphate isomerase-like protein (cupin superfamily)
MSTSMHLEPRKTPAVARKRSMRQRRLHFTPHICHGHKYENLLPNRHGCRRLRVPTEQNPGTPEEGRLRTVRRQWNDHCDLRHDPAVLKSTPTTRFQVALHSTQAHHRYGLPKPLWVVCRPTKPMLNRSNHQTLNTRIRSQFRSRFRIHQDDHWRDELSSASSRISGPYASARLRT